MALEEELNRRIEDSVAQLDKIAASLKEVKRLAESNDRSSEKLASVASELAPVAEEIKSTLTTFKDTSSNFKEAVDAVNAADPKAVLVGLNSAEAKIVGELASLSSSIQESQLSTKEEMAARIGDVEQVTETAKNAAIVAAILAAGALGVSAYLLYSSFG
jgi:methyl-accepting chemotaxis protein